MHTCVHKYQDLILKNIHGRTLCCLILNTMEQHEDLSLSLTALTQLKCLQDAEKAHVPRDPQGLKHNSYSPITRSKVHYVFTSLVQYHIILICPSLPFHVWVLTFHANDAGAKK